MDLKQHHITAREDRIPFTQKVAYGMGAIVPIIAISSVNHFTSLYYIIGLGISPILIGYASAIPRVWDAFTDPLVGNLSDNTRSRFGRRIPYVLIGGLLVGITFAMLWMPPAGWGQKAVYAYFLIMLLVFYTAITVFMVPHGALGLEMSNDYHERTRVFAYASFIGNVAAIVSPWLYYIANRPIFKSDVEGIKWVGIAIGLIFFLSAMVCAFVCKESKLEQAEKQKKVKFWESVKITCKNHTFIMMVVIFVLVIVGFQLVMGFNSFIMIYYIFSGSKDLASKWMGWNGTIWAVVAIIGIFPMTWLSSHLGKRRTVMVALIVMTIGNLLKIVCYSREYPWLTFIPTAMLSFGMVIVFTLVNAMNADICDEDELVTGKRREGSYYAVYGWWWKVAASIATVISGYILKAARYDHNLAQQSDSTLFWLRFWEIGLPAILCSVSVLLLTKYPLTEDRAYEIKELLKKRGLAAIEAESGQKEGE